MLKMQNMKPQPLIMKNETGINKQLNEFNGVSALLSFVAKNHFVLMYNEYD